MLRHSVLALLLVLVPVVGCEAADYERTERLEEAAEPVSAKTRARLDRLAEKIGSFTRTVDGLGANAPDEAEQAAYELQADLQRVRSKIHNHGQDASVAISHAIDELEERYDDAVEDFRTEG